MIGYGTAGRLPAEILAEQRADLMILDPHQDLPRLHQPAHPIDEIQDEAMTQSQIRRHHQTSSESKVVVTGYDRKVISDADESGTMLVSTLLHEQFSGSLTGTGVADHVRVLLPNGDDTFTGIARFTGTLDGRVGSFALTAEGYTVRGVVHGHWQVVPGSATGELTGLRGYCAFTAEPNLHGQDADNHYGTATDSFTYWYED